MAWQDAAGNPVAEELVLPPRELGSCNAEQIIRGLVDSLERFGFGKSFSEFLQAAADVYQHINVCAVGDSASANCKGITLLFLYLQDLAEQHNILVTCFFTPCLIHQYARVLLLHLEHRALSASLYSISRLHQQAPTRRLTEASLRQLLLDRFDFRPDSMPPRCPATDRNFRRHLVEVLSGDWLEDPSESQDAELQLLRRCLDFFNGDLVNSQALTHHCKRGCHMSKQHALNDVPGCPSVFPGL